MWDPINIFHKKLHWKIDNFSSILYVTIYDEDRFGEPEFLGRVGVPVATLRNGARVLRTFYLRDKNLKRYSKGTVDLVLAKKWEPWKVKYSIFWIGNPGLYVIEDFT